MRGRDWKEGLEGKGKERQIETPLRNPDKYDMLLSLTVRFQYDVSSCYHMKHSLIIILLIYVV